MKEQKPNSTVWLSPVVLDGDYHVQFRHDHIHVTLGKLLSIDREKQAEYWGKLRRLADEHGTSRILVEGNVPAGERDTGQIIEAGMSAAKVPSLWMAYCLDGFEKSDASELYETIAAS